MARKFTGVVVGCSVTLALVLATVGTSLPRTGAAYAQDVIPSGRALELDEALKTNLVEAAGWPIAEFTPEHVEARFGINLGPPKILDSEGLVERSSTGKVHISISTKGQIYRNLLVDWGPSAKNPSKFRAPTACVLNSEISEELTRRGWSLDHMTTGAPLDNTYSSTKTMSEQYQRSADDGRVIRRFTLIYSVPAEVRQSRCVSQFIISIEPHDSAIHHN